VQGRLFPHLMPYTTARPPRRHASGADAASRALVDLDRERWKAVAAVAPQLRDLPAECRGGVGCSDASAPRARTRLWRGAIGRQFGGEYHPGRSGIRWPASGDLSGNRGPPLFLNDAITLIYYLTEERRCDRSQSRAVDGIPVIAAAKQIGPHRDDIDMVGFRLVGGAGRSRRRFGRFDAWHRVNRGHHTQQRTMGGI
jgi:hypothetical protein